MLVPEGSLQAKKWQLAGLGSEQKVGCSSRACLYRKKKRKDPQIQVIQKLTEKCWGGREIKKHTNTTASEKEDQASQRSR